MKLLTRKEVSQVSEESYHSPTYTIEHLPEFCARVLAVLDRAESAEVALLEERKRAEALRAVILEFAPCVAVFSRDPMIAPEIRAGLAALEPVMLAALGADKGESK